MPKSKAGTANRRGAEPRRFEEVNKSPAQIVKDAAALLDEELAAGIEAAKQAQQRFRKQGRIDPADFSDALKPFQADGHEVIALLNDWFDEMQSQENFQLIQKPADFRTTPCGFSRNDLARSAAFDPRKRTSFAL